MEEATIVLTDEEGKQVEFDHILTFGYEGEKYIALMPNEPVDGINDDEVLILRITNKDGEDVLESITNEVLLEEVFNEFLDIVDEQEEEDETSD